MRICLVSEEYPPETARGGIGTQNWNKARMLARQGHTVHVLSCGHPHPNGDLTTQIRDGVVVHRMQPPGEEARSEFPVYEAAVYRLGYTWSVARHLHHLTSETVFDVIDFAEYGAEGFAYQLNRTSANWIPVVVQLHGPLAMFTERIGWPERTSSLAQVGAYMEGVSIAHADALMACSANIAEFTAEYYRLPRETIDVVHCGVDAEQFRPGPLEARSEKRPTVLFVGNIAPNKGVLTVLEAVLRLRARFPAIRLQILGKGDQRQAEYIQQKVRDAGARPNVELPGFVGREELPAFYRQADVFASPAQHEPGVANVYLEAMASSCPVIACNTGGAPEAVSDGETGLLVAPCDVDATVTALERILADAQLRRRMGQAARTRVEEYFGMNQYLGRVLDTYAKAIASAERKRTQFWDASPRGGG